MFDLDALEKLNLRLKQAVANAETAAAEARNASVASQKARSGFERAMKRAEAITYGRTSGCPRLNGERDG